jgi:hypothetical protein
MQEFSLRNAQNRVDSVRLLRPGIAADRTSPSVADDRNRGQIPLKRSSAVSRTNPFAARQNFAQPRWTMKSAIQGSFQGCQG